MASSGNENHPNRHVSDLIDMIKQSADKLHAQGSTRGDLKIISRAMRELAYAFKVFTPMYLLTNGDWGVCKLGWVCSWRLQARPHNGEDVSRRTLSLGAFCDPRERHELTFFTVWSLFSSTRT